MVDRKQHEQLLVQAPTGIGKTMASIYPAVKALGEGHTEKIFYLTARTTGQVAAEEALVHTGEQLPVAVDIPGGAQSQAGLVAEAVALHRRRAELYYCSRPRPACVQDPVLQLDHL